jgi:hypothetical protein
MSMTEEDYNAQFGSKFLSAADLKGKRPKVRIESAEMQTLGTERKTILHLVGVQKALVLNVTNGRRIGEAFGRNPAKWAGATLELYSEPTTFQGRTTEGIRVLPLVRPAPAAQPKPASSWPDDEPGDPGFSSDFAA